MKESFTKNFRHATLNFIFIVLFVNVFQYIFGMENSIVGVIFTIMMSASMVRDLTATPVKHLCIQTGVLFLMAVAACFVTSVPPMLALPVNLSMIFLILYAFTYEYVSHLYFPYILSYLFLVFISPVTPAQLPKRLLGVFVGAVCIILYQLVNGRNRVVETARDVLVSMIDEADGCIRCLLSAKGVPRNPEQLRAELCKLSKIVYDRRKSALCISDASFSMIDAGRGLENLVLLLYEMEGTVTEERAKMLRKLSASLTTFRSYMLRETSEIPAFSRLDFGPQDSGEAEQFYQCLVYIRGQMLQMTRPEKQKHYRRTLLSLSTRLKAALRVSPVRVIYALRVSCLLALCTLAVQLLALPHGKWLLFTVASVSLPYADDVGTKAKKRMRATLIGGACSIAVFSLISSMTGRTIVMMLSGYLSFYFTDYSGTFACSTVGALGGAVIMSAFGWGPVGYLSLVRLGYIVLGVLIAFLANDVFFPFKRAVATRQLVQKYVSTTEFLSRVCKEPDTDPQLYYGLVIQAHLQEEKLRQNAEELSWDGAKELLERCRQAVRQAHRSRPASCSMS
ncbi:FUSC family protein [Zongyangia hominis]|nr:FUSC family protein [Zongyangia hominis]